LLACRDGCPGAPVGRAFVRTTVRRAAPRLKPQCCSHAHTRAPVCSLFCPAALPLRFAHKYPCSRTHALQGKLKLSRSQCRRVFEILQRHLLTKGDDQQAKDYRLFIKKRLIQPYLRQKKEDRRREKNLTKEELDYHKQQDEVPCPRSVRAIAHSTVGRTAARSGGRPPVC